MNVFKTATMKKMSFVQMATIWLIIVVIFDVMKRSSTITIAAELFLLAITIALLMMFWIHKRQNSKFFKINARDLSIFGSDDSEFWSWIPLPNENPNEVVVEVAVLKEICWLDVSGHFNTINLCLDTKYEVNFVVKLEDTAYGWDLKPIKLKLIMPSGSEIQEHRVNFSELPRSQWIDVQAGEFIMSKENIGEIKFSLYEHEGDRSMSGLIVKGVVICPADHV